MSEVFPQDRRFPRIPSHHPVFVSRLDPAHPTEGFAKTEVVGLGGCMFVADEPLGLGSLLKVLISVEGTVLETVSRVVYELPQPEGKVGVGVEFLEIAPEAREILARLLIVGP